jgi:hypothetical protein
MKCKNNPEEKRKNIRLKVLAKKIEPEGYAYDFLKK